MNTFSHTRFSYEKGTRIFATEISTLEGHTTRSDVFCRVWPDACDVGFKIMGKHGIVRFVMDKIVKDDEGDILYWRLTSVPGDLPKGVAPVQCVVFND